MIQNIIRFSIKNKLVIGLGVLGLVVWGIFSLSRLPINSIPDVSSNQVRVITVSPDLATQEVEQLITYPVEQEMANLPGVKNIRSVSKFGLSVVTVVFEDEQGTYLPRQLIQEKIKAAEDKIPEGLGSPEMGPIISGLGEIYQWVVDTKPGYDTAYSAMELRTIQDWIVKRQMAGVEGVVEINSWGGFLKQYEVAIDPDRLKSMDLTVRDVYEALENNNSNAGGSYIEKNSNAYYIRGEGLMKSLEDIRNTRVAKRDGFPIHIGDVAKVQFGHATRMGAFTYNGKGEAVAGQAMMLKGENSWQVIQNVKERMEKIKQSLPEGVVIRPFIDRSKLINETTSTVTENLALGGLIVIFVLILLLGNWRSGLIVASVIPLSFLFSLSIMNLFKINVNLMSMGAMDFGIIVDGAVIIVEFMVYQLFIRRGALNKLSGASYQEAIDDLAIDSSSRMMRTAFFGQVIILIVFLPILTLTGVEGKMFRPMALTFIFALLGAMILCLTYVPMMIATFLKAPKREKRTISDRIMDFLDRIYQPVIRAAMRFRMGILTIAIGLLVVTLFVFMRMGAVFVPQLDEGSLVIHPILKSGTSLSYTVETVTELEQILLEEFPNEVDDVATRIGTGEVPADPMSLEMSDMFVTLKPDDQWERASSKQDLIDQMRSEMKVIPGVSYSFSQPIEMMVSQFLTGVRADIAVKIFGDDLEKLQEKGNEAQGLISEISGIQDISVEKVTGLSQMVVDYNRRKMAEYGIDIATVNRAISTGFSGGNAGTLYEGERRFDLVVRLDEEHRQDLENLKQLYVETDEGQQVPLKEVADISYETGPAQISREQIQRRIVVSVNAGDRDVASLVNDIQQRLSSDLNLPAGYNVSYGGDFENLEKAQQRLSYVVPIALLLILVLLYITFNSVKQSLMVFSAIPLAAIGGVFALYIRGMPFSVSAAVGFIALSGIAVLNGIVLVSFFNELKQQGEGNVFKRIFKGTRMRLRPVLLTASTDALGFLPMAVSASTGAEVQRPLATVVIGGLITASLLTMIVLPIIYSLVEGGWKKKATVKPGLIVLAMIGGLFCLPNNASAQESVPADPEGISLEQAIDSALLNHPSVEAGKYAVESRKAMQGASWDLGQTLLFYDGEEVNKATQEGIRSYGINQQLDLPPVYIREQQFRKAQTSLEKQKLNQTQKSLIKKVKQAYTENQYARERLRLYKRLDTVYERYKEAARLRQESGETGTLEKLAAESEFQEVRVQLKNARANLAKAQENLKQWLNTDDTVLLAESGLAPLSAVALRDTGQVEENPAYQINEKEVNTAEADQKRAQAEWWPKLSLTYREQEISNMEGQDFYGWRVGFSIPLAFWARSAEVKARRLEVEREKADLQAMKTNIQSRIRQQVETVDQYREQVDYYRNQRLSQAEKLMKNAVLEYEQGAINYPAYARYMEQAVRIKADYLEAVKNYNEAVIELEYMVGN